MGLKENRNILLFYLLTFVSSSTFIVSNWIYFWTRFMTFGQLGLIDGVAFGFALLLDIPTGGIADFFGRKRTVQFAMLASLIGITTMTFANSMPQIFLGWMVTMVGFSFYSGAAEALAYDTLVDLQRPNDFDKVISRSHSLEMIANASTTLVGGFAFIYHFRLPHLLWAIAYLIGFVLSLFLVEAKKHESFSFNSYFSGLWLGAKELFQPSLRRYFLFFLALLGVYYLYSWGSVRPAMATSFGFYSKEQAVILAVLSISSAFLVNYVPWLRRKMSNVSGLAFFAVLMGVGFTISYFPIGYLGFFAMALIAVGGKLAYPWISTIVNTEISSRFRATTLSTLALVTKTPYVLLAILAGNSIQNGGLNYFVLGIGITIFLFTGVSLALFKSTLLLKRRGNQQR